jgi:hypothetical protein
MPNKKKVVVSKLKGVRLYNYLLRELREQNQKNPKQQQLGVDSRRRIVKDQLYPLVKANPRIGVRAIRAAIKSITAALPPQEICNPLYLPDSYLQFIEYYEIDNHIRTQLPDCIDVKVNAGSLGQTRIFNTGNYSYYGNGVRSIVETIRQVVQNDSGSAYFDGIVRLKPNKRNNGNANNYYIEYILYLNQITEGDDTPVDYEVPKIKKDTQDDIRSYMSKRFKLLQREKAKRKRIAKKKAPKTEKEKKQQATAAVRKSIQGLRELYKQGRITKARFEKLKKTLLQIKNSGVVRKTTKRKKP